MPSVKTKRGITKFPYTAKGEDRAEQYAKKVGGKLLFKDTDQASEMKQKGTAMKKKPSMQVGPYKAVSSRINSATTTQSGNLQAKSKPTPPAAGTGSPALTKQGRATTKTNAGASTKTYGTTGRAPFAKRFSSKMNAKTTKKGTPRATMSRNV